MGIVSIGAGHVIRLRLLGTLAVWILFGCSRKELVGDAHYFVIGRARFRVIDLPEAFQPKRVIVPSSGAAVRMTGNAQSCALRCRSVVAAQNLPVLDRVDQPEPQELQRNAKSQIIGWLGCKIGLCDTAVWDCRISLDPRDDPELTLCSVPRPVGVELEADCPYRAELLFKGRDDVFLPKRSGTSRNIGFRALDPARPY